MYEPCPSETAYDQPRLEGRVTRITLTLLERGQGVVRLKVRIRGVQSNTNGDDVLAEKQTKLAVASIRVFVRDAAHRKRRLELWVPIYRFLHRKVVQLVGEYHAPDVIERARRQVVDEQLVRSFNISLSVVALPADTPVERVVFPYDSL
jgi:hypothetical protein